MTIKFFVTALLTIAIGAPALAAGKVKGLSCFIGDSKGGTTQYYGADRTGTKSEPQYIGTDYMWDFRVTRKSDTGNQFAVTIAAYGGHYINFPENGGGKKTNGVNGMGEFAVNTHFRINFKIDGLDQIVRCTPTLFIPPK